MWSNLQQKIQSEVRDTQPCETVVVGEFPEIETGDPPVPDSVDPPAPDDGIRLQSDDSGTCRSAGQAECSAGKRVSPLARGLIFFIRIYQYAISPWLPCRCRFVPTCSCYAVEALKKRGVIAGTLLTVYRILRCQPFCRGGYDPVPEKGFGHHTAGAKNSDEETE